jgi:hypothetical protein
MMEIIRIVAAVTAGALEDRVVIRIRMAGRAHAVRVAMTPREGRVLRVIEDGAGPSGGVVTGLAGSREELRLGRMTGIRRVVVVRLMAAHAGRWQCRVVVVHVAVRANARRYPVRTGEGKGRVVVIESGIRPSGRIVAEFARGRETRCSVYRIIRTRVVFLVAGVAQRCVQRVIVVDVAIGALARRHGVCTG